MADILSIILFTALAVIQFFGIGKRLRDQRYPMVIRIFESIADLLLGLFFVAMIFMLSAQAQAFLTRATGIEISNGIGLGLTTALITWLVLKAGLWFAKRKLAPAGQANTVERAVYQEVTGDASAAAEANRPEGMVRALKALGFRSVGLLRTSAVGGDGPGVTEVNEIFASPDWRAYAEPETFFACDAIALRTMLTDGTIVDTTLLVDHAPGTSAYQRWLTRIRWPRTNRPGANYLFERLEHTSAEALWARHQERLARIAAQRGAQALTQPGMASYIALSRRGLEIASQGILLDLIVLAIGLPSAMFLPLILLLLLGVKDIPLWLAFLWSLPLTWLAIRGDRHLPLTGLQKYGIQ